LIQFRPGIFSRGLAAIAICVLLLEAVLRMAPVRDALPIRTHFHEPGVVIRLQTLDELIGRVPHVDVLFVGSSVVRCNIQPLLFDEVLARRGWNVVSFNAGLSGLWPRAVDLYTEQLWLPRTRPLVVVQGIRFGELFPSRRARKYEAIITSPVESSWQRAGVWASIRAAAFEHIHLLQYQGVWPMWLQQYRNGRAAESDDEEVRVFTDARGWTPRLRTLDIVRSKNLLKDEQPNPTLDAAGSAEDALTAIRETARAARHAGAAYVLVNVPEHSYRWSGADGRERYAAYLDALANLGRTEAFPFIDVTRGDPAQFSNDAEYSDYHHMSPAGAARFTTLLATEFDGRLVRADARRASHLR